MPIPGTLRYIDHGSEREITSQMLIDADNPASSTAAACLL
jgi:hypothetical protein